MRTEAALFLVAAAAGAAAAARVDGINSKDYPGEESPPYKKIAIAMYESAITSGSDDETGAKANLSF